MFRALAKQWASLFPPRPIENKIQKSPNWRLNLQLDLQFDSSIELPEDSWSTGLNYELNDTEIQTLVLS